MLSYIFEDPAAVSGGGYTEFSLSNITRVNNDIVNHKKINYILCPGQNGMGCRWKAELIVFTYREDIL